MTSARPVLLESPYGSDDPAAVARNVRYADACQLDALRRGEAPMLGHLLYTRVVNDRVPAEREIGLRANLAWVGVVDALVVYVDRGISSGMRAAIERAYAEATPIELRRLGEQWETAPVRQDVPNDEARRLIER
jgi:hypothetical protein